MTKNAFSILLLCGLTALVFSCTEKVDPDPNQNPSANSFLKSLEVSVSNYTANSSLPDNSILSFIYSPSNRFGYYIDSRNFLLTNGSVQSDRKLLFTFSATDNISKKSNGIVYFPYNSNLNTNAIILDYHNQRQVGNNSYAHITEKDYCISEMTIGDGEQKYSTLFHVGCLLVISVKLPSNTNFNRLVISSDASVFPVQLNCDLSSLAYTSIDIEDNLNLGLSDICGQIGSDLIFTMMCFPFDGENHRMILSLLDDNNHMFSTDIRPIKTTAGQVYYIIADQLEESYDFGDVTIPSFDNYDWK